MLKRKRCVLSLPGRSVARRVRASVDVPPPAPDVVPVPPPERPGPPPVKEPPEHHEPVREPDPPGDARDGRAGRRADCHADCHVLATPSPVHASHGP